MAHHREGGEERAWALMKSSLDVKEGGKSGSLSSDRGIKDESVLMGSGVRDSQGKPI